MDRTTIVMKNTIGRQTALCVVGNADAQVVNVTINDITFDSNSHRWHGYNASSGTATAGTEFNNFTGIYGAEVSSGATYTQSGKIVTVAKDMELSAFESCAHELFEVERALISANRRLRRAAADLRT